MSLPEFDTLLTQHPEDGRAILRLQDAIVKCVTRDEKSRFDLPMLLHYLNMSRTIATPQTTKRLLVELVKEQALQPLLFWECPNGGGPIFETENVATFPDWIECDRCNQTHWFDQAHVEVGFVATAHLVREVVAFVAENLLETAEEKVKAHERLNERRDAS